MRTYFRKAIKSVAYRAYSSLRLFRLSREIKGYRLFDIEKLKSKKTSDTLFILGSSPSLLSLNENDWRQVSSADSLALNRFCFHHHVPSYYWLELADNMVANHFVFEEIKKKYPEEKTVFIFNYKNFRSRPLRFESLPKSITSNAVFILPRVKPVSKWALKNNLKALRESLKRKSISFRSFIHLRGSVFTCTQIGVALGYKKIVYLGVDLKDQSYFYDFIENENAREHEKFIGIQEFYERRLCGNVEAHRTVRSDLDNLGPPMTDLLGLLQKEVCKPLGVQLFVVSKESLLAEHMPVYRW